MASVELRQRIRRLALANAVEHGGAPRPSPILARLLATDPSLRHEVETVRAEVERIVQETSALSSDAQSAELARLGGPELERVRPAASETGEFPELPHAVLGEVVLRLAPFPSGALHIGHARMVYVNEYYRKKYDGKILLVFDDTVGSEKKRVDLDMFDVIRQDLTEAGVRIASTFYKSDRVPRFYPWARRLIEKGAAYVCRCSQEILRRNREAGIACEHRDQDVATNLGLFDQMLAGTFGPGEAVLRLKTALDDADPAFRDRVLMRISDLDHPRVGTRYRVWPMLEFSWAVDDVELGVTHVLRGKDLQIEDRMQEYIWNLLDVPGPPFLHWGLLRVKEAKLSKSKSYEEVHSGTFDGWADPRTWSLRSLVRRGISFAAIRRFTLSFGLSLADIIVPAETLYAENRALIDASTARRMVVPDGIAVDVREYPTDLGKTMLANHPDRPEMGTRPVRAGPRFWLPRKDVEAHWGEEIRLKDLANIHLPPEGATRAGEIVSADFTSVANKRLPRLQWVSRDASVPIDILGLEGEHTPAHGEAELERAQPTDVLQFERVGFVRVEANWAVGTTPVRVCYGHP